MLAPPIYPTDERFLWRGVVEGFSNILEKEALERAKASSSPLHSSAVGIRHCHVTFPHLDPQSFYFDRTIAIRVLPVLVWVDILIM